MKKSIPNDLLPIVVAVERVTGTRTTDSTGIRWTLQGSRGVILQSWRVGGRRLTTVAAVEEFIQKLTEVTTPSGPKPQRSLAQRDRDIAKAERELEQLAKK